MNPDPGLLTREGVLAVLLLQIVCNFLWRVYRSKRENGNGKDYRDLVAAVRDLASAQKEALSTLEGIAKDAEHARASAHTIINILGVYKSSADLILRLLERMDERRDRK